MSRDGVVNHSSAALVPRPGVRTLAAQATREAILRAATKVFARHGFAGGIIGNRFHTVSGQLQSGTGGGGPGSSPAHEAFEFERAPGATSSR